LENLLPVLTFGAHKLVHSELLLDYLYELWHLLSALYSDMQKKILYRCTSTFSAQNYCSGFFFKSLSYLYEVVRTNFSVGFWIFAIFDRHFSEFVAPSSDENENHVLHLKGRSLLKNGWKLHQNRPINSHTILVRTMSPSNEQRSGLGAWQTNK